MGFTLNAAKRGLLATAQDDAFPDADSIRSISEALLLLTQVSNSSHFLKEFEPWLQFLLRDARGMVDEGMVGRFRAFVRGDVTNEG